MERIEVFPTSLFRFVCPELMLADIIEAMHKAEFRPSKIGPGYASNSVDTYLHRSIPALNDFIRQCNDSIWSEIGPPDSELLVTQSWATLSMPGQGIHAHRHANAYASGVLYLSSNQGGTTLFVDDPYRSWTIDTHPDDPVMQIEEPTVAGNAIMFPASVSHVVHPVADNYNRATIAWNTFPAGIFKEAKSLSQLEIIR